MLATQVRQKDSVYYFVSYPGHASTQSGLRKLLGGGSRPVRVSYDDVADGPRERHHRTLDIGELEAGSYSLTITFSDGSGRTRERRQEFRITE